MRRLNLAVFLILTGIASGILCSPLLATSSTAIILSCIGFLLLSVFFHLWTKRRDKGYIGFLISVIGVCFFTGVLATIAHDPLLDLAHFTHIQDDLPHQLSVNITEKLKPTKYQDKYVAQLTSIDSIESSGKILLNIYKDSLATKLHIGDNLVLYEVLAQVPQVRSPLQFDYGKYLKSKHIYGQVTLSTSAYYKLKTISGNPALLWAARFRESVQEKLKIYPFTQRQLSIINALILGQRQDIDKEVNKNYAAAGMMHILAVSGLHVGIILLLLRALTKPLKHRKWKLLRSVIIITLIWVFAIITGLSPSVMRAATMFTFLELGSLWGGKRATQNALIYSAIALLLLSPNLIYHVGFQLSYLAVAAILWIQPWLHSFWSPNNYVLRILWGTITVTTAAQLGVVPLSLYYFHQFPGLFFISNIVVLPLLGYLLASGIIIVILASINLLPDAIVSMYGTAIDTLNNFIGWVAHQESFVIQDVTISTFVVITSYILIMSTVAVLKKYTYVKLYVFGLSALLFLGAFTHDRSKIPEDHFVIFQQSRASLFGMLTHNRLTVFSNDSIYTTDNDYKIKNYRQGLSLSSLTRDALGNIFRFKQKNILRIDSLGIYEVPNLVPDYIVLTESPQINLQRLILQFPNASIIADGSNYRSYVERWRATCQKTKIPFHSTYEKGAFVIYE